MGKQQQQSKQRPNRFLLLFRFNASTILLVETVIKSRRSIISACHNIYGLFFFIFFFYFPLQVFLPALHSPVLPKAQRCSPFSLRFEKQTMQHLLLHAKRKKRACACAARARTRPFACA